MGRTCLLYTSFASDFDGVRHNVAGCASLDDADVAGGLEIDATERHGGDSLGGNTNGVDPLLRLGPGMGGHAVNSDLQLSLIHI